MESNPEPPAQWAVAPPDDLCLSFVNTRFWRGSPHPTESLAGIADLLDWIEKSRCIDPGLVAGCRAGGQPGADGGVFAAAIELREMLYRLLSATAAGTAPTTDDLARLNAALAMTPPRMRLQPNPAHGYVWELPPPELPPSQPSPPDPALAVLLAPVLWSAGDLLAGPRRDRLRCCANPRCRWLFLDESKSANRRWCSMSTCGNRAKAQRHALRQRLARQVTQSEPGVPDQDGEDPAE